MIRVSDGIFPLIHPLQRVATAAASVLGTTGSVSHELLQLGADFLGFVPVPGLELAARTLLEIWDTLQQVDVSLPRFSSCFPLIINPTDQPSIMPSADGTMCRHLAVHSRRNPRSRKRCQHRATGTYHQACRVSSHLPNL